MSPDHTMKTCSKCGRELPATLEHFYKNTSSRSGLTTACRTCIKAANLRAYHDNPEPRKQKVREYNAENRVAISKRRSLRNASDPSKNRNRVSKWKREHPEALKAQLKRRKAMLRGAVGSFSGADLVAQYKAQGGRCWWCGCDLDDTYHIDHRIPLVVSNDNSPGNICLTCPTCNLRKNSKMPWEFNGRLL